MFLLQKCAFFYNLFFVFTLVASIGRCKHRASSTLTCSYNVLYYHFGSKHKWRQRFHDVLMSSSCDDEKHRSSQCENKHSRSSLFFVNILYWCRLSRFCFRCQCNLWTFHIGYQCPLRCFTLAIEVNISMLTTKMLCLQRPNSVVTWCFAHRGGLVWHGLTFLWCCSSLALY